MFALDSLTDFHAEHEKVRRWRYGRIVFEKGCFVRLEKRLMCGNISMAQVWWQAKYGRSDDSICWIDYHQPLGTPTFLTLDSIRAGSKAGYRSLSGAVHLLHEIARIRNSHAIVAHVSNSKISDRFLSRMGWEQHLHQWSGRHWIRRFYQGYPSFDGTRFAIGTTPMSTA